MPPSALATQLDLFVRCERLRDRDTFSKSDPYALLYVVKDGRRTALEVGRTEIIRDKLNPSFERPFTVDYLFEQRQEFELVIYDDDGKGPAGDDPLGSARFILAHVVGSRRSTLEVKIAPPFTGSVFITGKEQASTGRDTVTLEFAGHGLPSPLCGTPSTFYILQRKQPNGAFRELFRSHVASSTADPKWRQQRAMLVSQLTSSGEFDRETMRVKVMTTGLLPFLPNREVGSIDLSFNGLREAQRLGTPLRLSKLGNTANPQQQQPLSPYATSSFANSSLHSDAKYGEITITTCDILHYPSFIDLLQQGLQVSLAVSIDFTASNGPPQRSDSLHNMSNPLVPNQYVQAIASVGEILMEYDSTKRVPVFGFGAMVNASRQIEHFFNVTRTQDPYVAGVQGILDAYSACLPTVLLAGPTNFAPTISAVQQTARTRPNVYTVLLILTDGEITDMDATIHAIVGADSAPLSIIIVGVGNKSQFEMMHVLDGDNERLRYEHTVMQRDIVQFVPFREFVGAAPGALAAEVLREVPGQVMDWAINSGFTQPIVPGSEAANTAEEHDLEFEVMPPAPAAAGLDDDMLAMLLA